MLVWTRNRQTIELIFHCYAVSISVFFLGTLKCIRSCFNTRSASASVTLKCRKLAGQISVFSKAELEHDLIIPTVDLLNYNCCNTTHLDEHTDAGMRDVHIGTYSSVVEPLRGEQEKNATEKRYFCCNYKNRYF